MNKELTKKAVDMLLKGATLLSDPCPYCTGVRILKDGNAFCVGCGREPKDLPEEKPVENSPISTLSVLEKKLETLSKELEAEKDHKKQQDILTSINSLIDTINRLKKQ